MGEQISQMFWDMIAIPAMLSKCERVVSSARRLITYICNSLKKNIIETFECLNAWYKQELVSTS